MKNNTFIRTSAGIVAVFFAIAPLVHAEVATGIRMEGTTGGALPVMKVETETKSEVKLTPVQMKALMEAQAETKLKAEGAKMEVSHKMEDGTEMEGEDDSKMEESGLSSTLNLSADLDIDLDDAEEAEDSHAKGEVKIDEADEVESSADFEHFVEFKAKSDKHIKHVKIKDNKLIVVYAMPVKFFGFWDTTLDTTTEVNAEGEAEVSFPWYSIFMKKDFSKKTLEPMFGAAIKSHMMVMSGTAMSATTSATASATRSYSVPHMLEAIVVTYGKVNVNDINIMK